MSSSRKPQAESEQAERRYFIVNPSGTIHEVTREIASARLKQVGYRKATRDEIALYEAADGNQRAGSPLCEPYSDDPDAE